MLWWEEDISNARGFMVNVLLLWLVESCLLWLMNWIYETIARERSLLPCWLGKICAWICFKIPWWLMMQDDDVYFWDISAFCVGCACCLVANVLGYVAIRGQIFPLNYTVVTVPWCTCIYHSLGLEETHIPRNVLVRTSSKPGIGNNPLPCRSKIPPLSLGRYLCLVCDAI